MPAEKPPKINRTLPDANLAKLRSAYAQFVGEIIVSWNDLQAGCFLIYATVSEPNHSASWNISRAIWHSTASDSVQREMMMNAAKAALPPKSKHLKRVEWLKNRADKLAALRNDPAHSPITFGSDIQGSVVIKPNVFISKDAAIARLLEKPLQLYWKTLAGDLFALAQFAEFLSVSIATGKPLPHRPRVKSIPASRPPKRQRCRKRGRRRSRH